MILKRIKPESSIDYREKFGPVVFTCGCNFRCGFCHNPELVKKCELLNEEELKELEFGLKDMKLKTEIGWYNGITITGGEPTIHENLPAMIKRFKEIGLNVKLDTNGSNPEMLKYLIENKMIDYVAVDIKASKELYDKFTGVNVDISKIEESIKLLAKNIDFELRTTFAPYFSEGKLVWMNENEIIKMRDWISSLVSRRILWVVQQFSSRNIGEILDDNLSIENIPENMKETPQELLEKACKVLSEKFDCKII